MHSICEGKSRHTTLVKTYSWTASLLFARSISFWTASWHTGHPSGSYILSKSIRVCSFDFMKTKSFCGLELASRSWTGFLIVLVFSTTCFTPHDFTNFQFRIPTFHIHVFEQWKWVLIVCQKQKKLVLITYSENLEFFSIHETIWPSWDHLSHSY